MRLPQTPPKLNDLMAEVKPPERLMELFSLMREAKMPRHYLHWDRLRRCPPPPGVSHREWWLVQKLSRMDALQPIPLKDAAQGAFQFAVPELVMEELHQIDLGAGGLGVCRTEFIVWAMSLASASRAAQWRGGSLAKNARWG